MRGGCLGAHVDTPIRWICTDICAAILLDEGDLLLGLCAQIALPTSLAFVESAIVAKHSTLTSSNIFCHFVGVWLLQINLKSNS